MYKVESEIEFEASHYLLLAGGQQEETHSHAWRVRASVEADELDESGLVMDFHHLQRLLAEIVAPMSRAGVINEMSEFSNDNPSAERIARYIYEQLAVRLTGNVRLAEVLVLEGIGCRAGYRVMDE